MALKSFIEGAAFGILNDILSEFRSNEGYAKPNKYEVIIYPPISHSANKLSSPGAGRPVSGQAMKNLALRCESVQLPGRNLTTSEDVNVYGPTRQVVDGVTFAEDLSCTFQESTSLDVRKFFEQWQESAYNPQTWNIRYYKEYIGAMDIFLLDQNDQKRYGLRCMEIYPKTINAASLGYGTNNTYMTTEVSFAFRNWINVDANSTPPTLGEKITQTIVNTVERQIQRNVPKVLNKLF